LTLAAFVVGNLRIGAQLPMASVGKLAVAASLVLGMASVVKALRTPAS
jgi:hypothetical protein